MMRNRKLIIVLLFVFNSILVFGQCDYTLDNYTHNDCYGDSVGSIDITILDPNAVASWVGPNGFVFSGQNLNNLKAGTYYLTITNSVQVCTLLDSIDIVQSNKISGELNLTGRCNNQDLVDVVITDLWGGTPPYSTIWNNIVVVVGTDTINLPTTTAIPHVLTITDVNSCTDTLHLWVPVVNPMTSFMSSVAVICKDDNSGQARVFVQEGTPPFVFNWEIGGALFSQEDDILVIDSFSSISGLFPGVYAVEIIDDMGCIIKDSIEVKSNPNICLTIYKAFSPNDDATHEFWEIENIHVYPEAVVSVYDRNGRQVFRRRNYINSEEIAFGGKDINDQPLPSATYYYVIDLENGDDVFKGTLTIVR
jgi:gliding motility-associated-like protein